MSVRSGSEDVDLTNLNWVSGAPAPLPSSFSVSPPDHKQSPTIRNRLSPYSPFRSCAPSSTASSPATPSGRPVEIVVASPWRKENVSKTSLEANLHDDSTNKDRRNDRKKPTCSYTCLIGMALRASPGTDGCLPVHEIYKYIE